MKILKILLPALLGCWGAAATAQSVMPGMVMSTGADFAMSQIHADMLESSLAGGQRGRAPGAGSGARAGNALGAGFLGSAAAGIDGRALSYQPSDALAREALGGYVSRLKANDPKAAGVVAEQFGRNDYRQVYRGLTRGTGLRDNDLADVMSAWTMLGWMVANDSQSNPDPAKLRGLRGQMVSALGDQPRFQDPRTRAALAEEMKIHFVVLHAGWQSAKREGRLSEYADGVARLFRRTGTDLRAVSMTPQGMVGR